MKQQNLAQALQAKSAGFQLNPEGTDWVQSPEDIESKAQGAGLLRSAAMEQLKQIHPEYSQEQLSSAVPENLRPEQYEKFANTIKPTISAQAGITGKGLIADALNGRTAIARGNLDLQRQKTASGIAKEVNTDKIIQAADMQQNSIEKGLQQLNSKDKPITNSMLNEIQADYANALTGGRQAAQGTIHDQQMQTAQAKLANLKQYITGNPTAAATPEQVAYFKTAFNELKGLNRAIRSQRVNALTGQKEAAFGNTGAVGNVIGKLRGDASGEGLAPLSPEDQQAIQWAKANRGNADADKILQMHGIK
jgi:hypothetical protein